MEEKMIYTAYDGTEFKSEEEVIYYEIELLFEKLRKQVKFRDWNNEPIESLDNLDAVVYLSYEDNSISDDLTNLFDFMYIPTCGIYGADMYAYDRDTDTWASYTEIVEEINKLEFTRKMMSSV